MYSSLLKNKKSKAKRSKYDIESEEIKMKKDQIEHISILLEYMDWKIKNHKEDKNIKIERNNLEKKKKLLEKELDEEMEKELEKELVKESDNMIHSE